MNPGKDLRPKTQDPLPALAEDRIELMLGRLLQVGVSTAAAIVIIGAGIYLFHEGKQPANYSVFGGEPARLKSLGGVIKNASELDGRAVIQLGILVLIATPVARVAFSLVAFLKERDRLYAGF